MVGNGPTELGKGRGKEIDSYPTVIRFNNYLLTRPWDYGEKTTHWATTFRKDVQAKVGENYEAVYWTNPLEMMLVTNPMLAWSFIPRLHQIPSEVYFKLPLFSCGITLLHWIYSERGSLNDVEVFGFGFFNPEEKHHYWSALGADKDHNHEAEREAYLSLREGRFGL